MKPIKTIKNGWNKFTVVVKDKDYSTREAVLFAICTFLTGLVLGMLCSPRKNQTFGSYNGNCSEASGMAVVTAIAIMMRTILSRL